VSIFIAISVEDYVLTFAVVMVSLAIIKLLQATGARTSEKSVSGIKSQVRFVRLNRYSVLILKKTHLC